MVDVGSVVDAVLSGDASDKPIENYINSQKASYSSLLAVESTQKDNHGVGATASRTTAEDNREAKSFRFNSGTLFDIYAPQLTTNANVSVHQAKTQHNQVFHQQTSTVHSWSRSQNINVVQTANNYSYATDRNYVASTNYFHESSYNHQYADYFRLQVGQSSGDPVSKSSRLKSSELYGSCNIGAHNNFTVSTRKGLISMSAEDGFIAKANGAVSVSGKKGVSINSSIGANITARADLSMSSMGPVSVSSLSFLSLNSGGVMLLDAGIIFVGMGAGLKPSVNLDATLGTLGKVTSALAGSGFSVGSVVGLASAVASGNITGAVSSLAGALVPGAPAEFLSKVSSFTPAGIASAFTGLLTGGEGLGSFLSGQLSSLFSIDDLASALPGITDIPGVTDLIDSIADGAFGPFLNFLGDPANGFTFKSYPDIKELDPYTSTGQPKPQPMASNTFTSEILTPYLPVQVTEQAATVEESN